MIQVSDVGVGDSSKALIAVLDRIVFFLSQAGLQIQSTLCGFLRSLSVCLCQLLFCRGPFFHDSFSKKYVEQVRNA